MVEVIFHLIIFGKAPEVALLHLDEICYGGHADVDHFEIMLLFLVETIK